MGRRTAIVATGQTHHKSIRKDVNGQELIHEAVTRCLEDGDLTIDDIDGVVIGNMDHFEGINYNDCWSVDGSGAFMKPLLKVTTGGTTGCTLAICGYHMVASGMFDKLLVIGWEKNSESDTTAAITTCADPLLERMVMAGAISPLALHAQAYNRMYGGTARDAARVSVRDHRHGCNNPFTQLRKEVTIEEVLESPPLADPLRLLDMCPRTDGACAVVFACEGVAEEITEIPAWVKGTANRHLYTNYSDLYQTGTLESMVEASKELYSKTGIREPLKELDVVELYQPFSWAGMIWIEDMGLCKKGEGPQLVWDGVTDMGGELPFNPSGGVICANPIGATGLIRQAEAVIQIQGKAAERQVPDVNLALATGFGGNWWTDLVLYSRQKPE